MSRTTSMKSYQPMLKEHYAMFGKDKKSEMRKKAMDLVMREGPSIAVKISRKPAGEMPEEMGMEKEMEMEGAQDQGDEQQGFVSFMVSPEEKQMTLEHRKQMKSGAAE